MVVGACLLKRTWQNWLSVCTSSEVLHSDDGQPAEHVRVRVRLPWPQMLPSQEPTEGKRAKCQRSSRALQSPPSAPCRHLAHLLHSLHGPATAGAVASHALSDDSVLPISAQLPAHSPGNNIGRCMSRGYGRGIRLPLPPLSSSPFSNAIVSHPHPFHQQTFARPRARLPALTTHHRAARVAAPCRPRRRLVGRARLGVRLARILGTGALARALAAALALPQARATALARAPRAPRRPCAGHRLLARAAVLLPRPEGTVALAVARAVPRAALCAPAALG